MTPSLPPPVAGTRRDLRGPAFGHVATWTAGPGDTRPPVVLLHSINAAASGFEMRPLFDGLADDRHVIALELPGYGHSDRADRRYVPALFAGAIRALLADLGRPVHLVGLSTSAEFAALAALAEPARVRTLALISPTGMTDHPLLSEAETAAAAARGERAHARLAGFPLIDLAYRALTSRPSIRLFLNMFSERATTDELVDYAWLTSHQPGAKHAPLWFLSGAMFTRDIQRRVYERLPQPGLVLYDRSSNVRFDGIQGFLARTPRWRAERIAPAKDLLHWEHPQRALRALTDFWALHDHAP